MSFNFNQSLIDFSTGRQPIKRSSQETRFDKTKVVVALLIIFLVDHLVLCSVVKTISKNNP
jgi:hypothetical protein